MKNRSANRHLLNIVLLLCLSMFSLQAGTFKWARIGNIEVKVVDNTDQDQLAGSRSAYYYYDDYWVPLIYNAGWHLGVENWTDENGNLWNHRVVGPATAGANEINNTFPIEDEDGLTLRRYLRHEPPKVKVNGEILSDAFPLSGDFVDPDYIPGTADMMFESKVNTIIGLTLDQRAFVWSSPDYDDFIIYDWTFTNTGNVDMDEEIELPNQTLEDLYFMRMNNFYAPGRGEPWYSTYGERLGDSLRMMYAYPARGSKSDYDDYGGPDAGSDFLSSAFHIGEAILHVDTSPSDETDNWSQPAISGVNTAELKYLKFEAANYSPSDIAKVYDVMENGFGNTPYNLPYQTDNVYAGSKHSQRMDEQGFKFPDEFPWWLWRAVTHASMGPYTLAPGESIRVVFALVVGTISPELGQSVGEDWAEGIATWEGLDILPPPFQDNPDLYDDTNDWAKDSWVSTGKDSLFKNAFAAQVGVQNDYDLPVPPRPPSVEVIGRPDFIEVNWGSESELDADFSGYRVYRSHPDTSFVETFSCGGNTGIPIVHQFQDTTAVPGVGYYYYVTAYDDGLSNNPSPYGGVRSLESGWNINRTTAAVYRTEAPGETLSAIRVVPNPLNLSGNNWPGEEEKIVFKGLPALATIKIYTESGDLVKTLEHVDESGAEHWGGNVANLHTVTESGQRLASGIYIARVTDDATGESAMVKFVIVR
ncbi:MAG: fibronectin type III domain-containing protein [Candidatus Marinimicrobia bacterium]|jgi:hypothetical protein|nr:fibronectin type III domain-containing protein [Candidatus Neomarinimicrobiota bacterium]MBT3825263.1 fibronectin type III domain-containing protein [Candidatus Neomarinimicrobiota bacterium]MBT4131161.1 fibronectin type III domain-containing protein [Candidatus Neomarinimicrobiota bacterium]MBT4294273.1 fibronectin type III domain-containing protein [Candidatus Neomarinimicrobiota bacterium]MBT4419273.1 fibronectin type III domain-containing protein [Candidatus Neomarinimicrobiota bacterium